VIPTCAQQLWFVSVMSAIMERTKIDVWYVMAEGLPMLITVKSVHNCRKIETDALKLLI